MLCVNLDTCLLPHHQLHAILHILLRLKLRSCSLPAFYLKVSVEVQLQLYNKMCM